MTTSANAQVFVNPVMPDQWLTSVTTTNAGVPVSSPEYQEADASKSLALSNCSNSGDILLSVWFVGQKGSSAGDIMYKLSGNSVPVKFRPTAIATLQGEKPTLYPNPATDQVYLPNEEGAFQIINSLGAKVAEGQMQQSTSIDVQNLPSGVYLLRTHSHTYPFTKL